MREGKRECSQVSGKTHLAQKARQMMGTRKIHYQHYKALGFTVTY